MAKLRITGATIPYQLRPRKAIERNIYIDLLKRLDASNLINLSTYRYVGFGAAYLEDFKQMHIELGITKMHCIEMDTSAFTRQLFNNPYRFVTPYNKTSTEYIDQDLMEADGNQVIWLDYAMPRHLRQQLTDIEMLCAKLQPLDIVKFTFNSWLKSFISSHGNFCREFEYKKVLQYLKDDPTFIKYLPDEIEIKNFSNFDQVIRAMAVRAINRGIAAANNDLTFQHLSAFTYADGQEMTTLTGVFCSDEQMQQIEQQGRLRDWPFYKPNNEATELIEATEIAVPDMTVSERIEIDKRIPMDDIDNQAQQLAFQYGSNLEEHIYLLKGYHKFYKYLPYYSKVIY